MQLTFRHKAQLECQHTSCLPCCQQKLQILGGSGKSGGGLDFAFCPLLFCVANISNSTFLNMGTNDVMDQVLLTESL